ncbi:MAG: helix-turn-helix domain-containing protein [Actinomycetia bacterium]|nr:helix-turn-helix domain-containing protein [Actinomycetes bacterium]
MERELISERTKAGLETAAKQGRKGGRLPKLTAEQRATVIDLRDGSTPISTIARTLGVSRDTIRKAINSASARSESDG